MICLALGRQLFDPFRSGIPSWLFKTSQDPQSYRFGNRKNGLVILPKEHSDYVGSEGSVSVALVFEMDNHQKLGKEDHVNQIRTHRPAMNRTF